MKKIIETNGQLIKELIDALKEYVYEEISSNAVKIIFDKKIDMTRVEKNLQLIE